MVNQVINNNNNSSKINAFKQMIDSDESYLLQSYNQNQPLFDNINVWASSDRTNMDYIYHHKNIKKYENKNKNKNKINHQPKQINSKIKQKQISFFHQRIMLDAIEEDQLQGLRTASKGKNLNNRNIVLMPRLYTQQLQSIKPYSFQTKTDSGKYQNQQKQKNKYNNIPYYSNQNQSQQNQSIYIQQQLQIANHFLYNKNTEFQKKFTQLNQFVNQVIKNYTNLTRKLQSYQKIVSDLQQIVENQQKYLYQMFMQVQNFAKKIQSSFNTEIFNHQYVINQFRSSFNIVQGNICQIIQNKIQSKIATLNQINYEGQYNNGVSFINHKMNHTKSVPSFLPEQQTVQKIDKRQQTKKTTIHPNSKQTKQSISLQFIQTLYTPKYQVKSISEFQNQDQQIKKHNKHNIGQSFLKQQNYLIQNNKSNKDQTGQTFRKLANFRIKQLQTQNILLKNQLNSANVKLMVIRNQNKQLRQIVQGLIIQVQKLSLDSKYNKSHLHIQ